MTGAFGNICGQAETTLESHRYVTEQLNVGGRSRSRAKDFVMIFESGDGLKPDTEQTSSISVPDLALIGVVGAQLRAMYDGLLSEPIPERLLAVMHRFEGADDPELSRGALPYGTKD
jgi:hypothetical protein